MCLFSSVFIINFTKYHWNVYWIKFIMVKEGKGMVIGDEIGWLLRLGWHAKLLGISPSLLT